MKRLALHAFCLVFLLAQTLPVFANERPLAPLEPIEQKDRSTLVLPGEHYQLIPNPGGGLLLLCGDRLAWLEDDGVTLVRETQLPRHYTDLAPRDGYFVAISRHDRVVEILDADTFQARSTITLTTDRLHRVAPHPVIPISYITTNDGDMPFLMFDELTGELRQDDAWLAREIVIDPTGSFMIAAYVKWVQVGERLHINGPNVLTTPEFDSIETLIRYHLDEKGNPVFAELRDGVGGGMHGLAASPDARRVTYLSFSGMSRRTLGGFDALDFKKLPTSYGVNEGGDPKSLDYHPVLELVGSPGTGGAVFFHSQTGRPERHRLVDPGALDAETTYDRLHFSPDGVNALLLYKVEDGQAEEEDKKPTTRVLVAARLALSKPELARVARGPAELEPVELPALPDAAGGADDETDLHAQMRQETMDWIKANSIFGPESRLSADVIRGANNFLNNKRGFWMMLEGGLTQSGKTTVIAVHEGTFMTAELSDEQAAASGIEPMQMIQSPGAIFDNQRPTRRVLSLDSPSLEKTDDGTIQGKVVLTKLGQADQGQFAMTFTHIDGGTVTTAIHHMGNWLTDERSEQPFRFNSPANDDDEPGLVIGFLRMTVLTAGRGNDRRLPLNDPILLIATHHPAEGGE